MHTLNIFNTYCFSTATVATRTCINVMLHAHCLFKDYKCQCVLPTSNVHLISGVPGIQPLHHAFHMHSGPRSLFFWSVVELPEH